MVKEIKKYKSKKNPKLTNEIIMEKLNYSFSRDAEWFKKTMNKIQSVKDELDRKFYTPEKKAQKFDFLKKLKSKLNDYKDAMKFSEKYRKIRFFERRKLERMLTKVKKEILSKKEEDIEKIKSLKENQIKIETDINYVKYYPKSYKYYSLFPNNDKDNPETLKKIEKMRKKIDFYVFIFFMNFFYSILQLFFIFVHFLRLNDPLKIFVLNLYYFMNLKNLYFCLL